jgi:hypothetical protein
MERRYATEKDVEAAMAQEGLYVSLPITNTADLTEAFNRILDQLQGEQDE